MDPYFERRSKWPGVHTQLMTEFRRIINARLPEGYVTDLEERLVIDEGGSAGYRADITVQDAGSPLPLRGGAAVLDAAPETRMMAAEIPERYLEIRTEDGELVTTIELLSYANKHPGRDRKQFLRRRQHLLEGESNYVEIDLLRGGLAMPGCESETAYRAAVHVAESPDRFGFWPIPLRERLPTVAVPLREPDPPVPLDLQAAVDETISVGRYAPRIYRNPPQPQLGPDDAEWAAALLKSAGVALDGST